MPIKQRRFLIHPNPWCSLNREGRASGVAFVDPSIFGTDMLGAEIEQVEMIDKWGEKETKAKHGQLIAPRQITRFRFKTAPVNVRGDGEAGRVVRSKIRNRELFAADEATAKAAGVKFVPHDKALEAARTNAGRKYDLQHGAGAFERVQAELAAECKEPAAKPPDIAPESDKTTGRKSSKKGD